MLLLPLLGLALLTPSVEDVGAKAHVARVVRQLHHESSVPSPPGTGLRTPHVASAENPCHGKKPDENPYFDNVQCVIDGVSQALEQAAGDVTKGYSGAIDAKGGSDVTDSNGRSLPRDPMVGPYKDHGLCPVNVHWHLGAEHRSAGEFDEDGSGPHHSDDDHGATDAAHRQLAGDVRQGLQCHHYDELDPKFTSHYDWKHCVGMEVGETYEVHWPHSAAGMCGTVHQYQTPFYDGVFCRDGIISVNPLNVHRTVGVQAQIYTIVNDEDYYYPDMMAGSTVDAVRGMGVDIATYTGSTTGTSRSNEICSKYSPITWQVDRKCHMVSASSFDKMCQDMKSVADDMSDDLHAHGAREVVDRRFVANNQVNRRKD